MRDKFGGGSDYLEVPLLDGEVLLAKGDAAVTLGWATSVGRLYLTDRRLIWTRSPIFGLPLGREMIAMALNGLRTVRATKPVSSAGNALLVESDAEALFFTFNGWQLPFWWPTSKIAGQWEQSITEVLGRPVSRVFEDSPALRLARAQIRRMRLAVAVFLVALFLLAAGSALMAGPVFLLAFAPVYILIPIITFVLWRYTRSLELAATPMGSSL